MRKKKKLKDLRKGERMYLVGLPNTTNITVESAKRTGDCVEVVLQWDNSTYVGYGHALGSTVSTYNKRTRIEETFTTDYEGELSSYNYRKRDGEFASIGRYAVALFKEIKAKL